MQALHTLFITTGLLAIFFIGLSITVIVNRFKFRLAIGHGQHPPLEAAMRAHANFAEYVPLILTMLYFMTLFDSQPFFFTGLCIWLFLARLSHAYGLLVMEQSSRYSLLPRRIGMLSTFLIILWCAISLMMTGFKAV